MKLYNKVLARFTLQQTLRSRRMLVALLVAAVPIAVGAIMIVSDVQDAKENRRYSNTAGGGPDTFEPGFLDLSAFVILGGTLPFIAILLAGGLVADEVEDRTLAYVMVKPYTRWTLYLSRLVPMAILAAGLGVIQIFLFWLMRLLSLAIVGGGHPTLVYDDQSRLVSSIPDVQVLLLQLPGALLATVLAAAAFMAIFGFVTLLTTRFHFLANLGVAALIEASFGNLGGRGLGVMTITYHARSLMEALDPTGNSMVDAEAPGFLAFLGLLALASIWTWAAMMRVRNQDFNVTSAAS